MHQLLLTFHNWKKRAEFFYYWDKDCEHRFISLAFEVCTTETYPMYYFKNNDTNRWKSIYIKLDISWWTLSIMIPYKRLPDHIPNERQLKRRGVYEHR